MGMGLATSLSLCLQLLILLTHFLKKERYLQFSLKAASGAKGFPESWRTTCSCRKILEKQRRIT